MILFGGLFLKKYDNAYSELSTFKAKDLMTKEVMTVQKDRKLIDAAHTMIGAHISCLVVLDDLKPIGIITERDFIKKLGMGKEGDSDLLVNDLMTKSPVTVTAGISLFEAERLMRTHNFRKLIVAFGEELRGILTQTDLCRAILQLRTPIIDPPLVKDIMTQKVLIASPDLSFVQTKKLMASKDMGSVVVANRDSIKGIFTEFDIVSEFFLNPNKLKNAFMRDLVTSPIICISPDFDTVFVNKLMLEHNFRRLPVMQDGKLVGIVTQTDVTRSIYSFLEKNKDLKLTSEQRKKAMIETRYDMQKKDSLILYIKKEIITKP